MKYPDCKTEMLSIYGYSYFDPCAIGFKGLNLNKDGTDFCIDLVYCPLCGTVKINLENK